MDIARVFMVLRPSAKFNNNTVNFFSIETIAETYIGDDLPTQSEMDAAWPAIEAQDGDDEFNRVVDAELREIDIQSIRSLREYIAAQPDAPQFIINHEADAADKRATRKP